MPSRELAFPFHPLSRPQVSSRRRLIKEPVEVGLGPRQLVVIAIAIHTSCRSARLCTLEWSDAKNGASPMPGRLASVPSLKGSGAASSYRGYPL